MYLGRWRSVFLAAGLFFTACGDDAAVKQEEKPEVVTGPLVITSPERATFHRTGEPLVVRGTGATNALLVNGKPAVVKEDGSFEAPFTPIPGLNLISAVDGERTVELPIVYGDYASPDAWAPSAITVDLGPAGFTAPDPAASLSTLATGAIAGQDIGAALAGTTQSGSAIGIEYTFTVTSATYESAVANVTPAQGGPNVAVTITKLVADGTMTIDGKTGPVQVTATQGVVAGVVTFAVDPNGKLLTSMPDANATLTGFKFESGNPLLDLAITAILKSKIEQEIAKAIKEKLAPALQGAFDQIALPTELDLSALGLAAPVALASKFDAAKFDPFGGTLSLTAHFGGPLPAGSPGATAPGPLVLGAPFQVGKDRPPSIGISLSMNAVNQLLYAAWGPGTIAFKAARMTLSPKLPPIAMVGENGELTLGLGEVLVTQEGQTQPMAAATVFQGLEGAAEADKLMLRPKGEPRLHITWLTGEPGPARDIIATAAKSQLKDALKPIEFPLPKIALDGLSPSFAGRSLAVGDTKVAVVPSVARVSATGTMSLVK